MLCGRRGSGDRCLFGRRIDDGDGGAARKTGVWHRTQRRGFGVRGIAEEKNNLANMANVCGDAAAELPRIMAEENGEKPC